MKPRTSLFFRKSGIQNLVHDGGRQGYQAYGVPVGGPMDRFAAKAANWLVGNPLDAPNLEITLMGPQIEFEGSCQIALTGANLSATLDGVPLPLYENILVKHGSVLAFGKAQQGCRVYLSVRGEWQVRKWLGSVSAATQNAGALTPDSVLKKNSILQIMSRQPIPKRSLPQAFRPNLSSAANIQLLAGPEYELFSHMAIGYFFSGTYQISTDANRMGYRLEGSPIAYDQKQEMISSAIVPGTIQISHSGQPIILMADAQTSGGYYRIANVISSDQDRLAQLKPGDQLRFVLVSQQTAQAALRTQFQHSLNLFSAAT